MTVVAWPTFGLGASLRTLLSPVLSYDVPVDAAFAVCIVAVFAVAAATRRLRVHGGLLLASVIVGATALAPPAAVWDAS